MKENSYGQCRVSTTASWPFLLLIPLMLELLLSTSAHCFPYFFPFDVPLSFSLLRKSLLDLEAAKLSAQDNPCLLSFVGAKNHLTT